MASRVVRLSGREARWLAIAAQGLARPRPRRVDAGHIAAMVTTLGAVQLDAVNVLERTQFVVLFSRLGTYEQSSVHDLTGPNGVLWEYWGHAASLMPAENEPLFRWRYAIGGTYVPGRTVQARVDAWVEANADYLAAVMKQVEARGPLTAKQLDDPRRRAGEWWEARSVGRQALAWLAGRGRLATWRSPAFESVYDLPERVLPAEVRQQRTPTVEDAHRALVRRAAQASGVGTLKDLAGYFMLQPRTVKPVLAELVRRGELVEVEVDGWAEVAYMPAGMPPTRPTRRTATVLSPFDSLIWDRPRTRRLFGFDYRIEVYVPERHRVFGYYVLPLLLGDRLVGRVDVKADRKASVLRVLGAFAENGVDRSSVAHATAAEVHALANWLHLDGVAIARRGDLAPALVAAAAER
jgi:uncharacterized protein YcaQ